MGSSIASSGTSTLSSCYWWIALARFLASIISLKFGLLLVCLGVPRVGVVAAIWSLESVVRGEVLETRECLCSRLPDLSFMPSSLLANLIPVGLITSVGTYLTSISLPEPWPLPLSFSGDVAPSIGEAAFYDTPMLSDKLSSPSRSLVYCNGVSEYSYIDALLNGDPFASFLDSDVFTFSICSFCSEIILAWCSENFCELSTCWGVCS